jgi:hypothetical protein
MKLLGFGVLVGVSFEIVRGMPVPTKEVFGRSVIGFRLDFFESK